MQFILQQLLVFLHRKMPGLQKQLKKYFFLPVKLDLQPEIEDFHMPDAGVAHNLVIVKISKSYPGQGMKVINSLSGAGQMMFTKYLDCCKR